jgi:lactate permease
MPTWTQVYTPVNGSVMLSALAAALPIAVLLGSLAFLHAKAHWAAIAGLSASLLVATALFGMPPHLAVLAAANGAAYGLFPIGWIVLGAIFVYDVTVEAGEFDVLRHSIAGMASDRRIQALLIAFCFGGFVEGAAGFGTPVAISAAMLIGLGFKPLEAARLALIGNTAPVAFGALGIPVIALSSATGLPLGALSATVGRQLPWFCILVPFWLIWVMAGRAAMWEIWPACLTAGLTFGAAQFLISNYHGPWMAAIGAALFSLTSLVILLRFWQPKSEWRFEYDSRAEQAQANVLVARRNGKRDLRAWTPWVCVSLLVFLWGVPAIKDQLNGGTPNHPNLMSGMTLLRFTIPGLNHTVIRTVPVVPKPTPEAAEFLLNWASATGTSLILAGIISGLLLGFRFTALLRILWRTAIRLRTSLLTIAAMLALGYTTRYAGLDATMGLAFAKTGVLFPFFSPLLGWLGVALTGSDTSSNVLFGGLQQVTARQLGISPLLAAAANSSGGVMGKMIDAQSIVVAGVATRQEGNEGSILRHVFWHSLSLACLVGVVVFLQARF